MPDEILIRPGLKYIYKNDHRDRSFRKSQWSINKNDERVCFVCMHDMQWHCDHKGWSLYLPNNSPQYLGVSNIKQRQLFIAKFIDGDQDNTWHGYPADYIAHQQDTPCKDILWGWKDTGYFSASKVRKMLRGQPCSL